MTITSRLHVRIVACSFSCCSDSRSQDAIMFRLSLTRPYSANYAQVLVSRFSSTFISITDFALQALALALSVEAAPAFAKVTTSLPPPLRLALTLLC
jgi:hypothetical protein